MHAQMPRSVRANMWARKGIDRGPGSIVLSASSTVSSAWPFVSGSSKRPPSDPAASVARDPPVVVAAGHRRVAAGQVELVGATLADRSVAHRARRRAAGLAGEIGGAACELSGSPGGYEEGCAVDAEELLEVA